MKNRCKQEELNRAFDMVKEGYTYLEVIKEIQINKSMLAREIRKRKNLKARKNIENYRISLLK